MSKPIPIELRTSDPAAIRLTLHHWVSEDPEKSGRPRKPVLLLHGASANHETFTTPNGGLAEWLLARHFDPWLLDWRGSSLVVGEQENVESPAQGDAYNFNLAAEFDIRAAIDEIRRQGAEFPIAALGHCMGGGILAEAVALDHVTAKDVDRIVLMALGLFYETPIDGRLKCEDRLLERLKHTTPPKKGRVLTIDPRVDSTKGDSWPEELQKFYESWPSALKFHVERKRDPGKEPPDPVNCMCNRLSFMYGMPYHHDNLVDAIHGTDSIGAELPKLFGAIPIDMYIHAARNIRQGHATFYDGKGNNEEFLSDAAREKFRRLRKVTLVTGALNRLWHRDSIDHMHEWLCRGFSNHLHKFRKHILPDYGHQDLLWGDTSTTEVFPTIEQGLTVNDYPEVSSNASLQRLASQGIPSRDAAVSPRR